MSKNRDQGEYRETEYIEDGYVLDDEPSDTFFEMSDSDEAAYDERERADRAKLLISVLLMLSVIAAVLLTVFGVRAFNQASDDAVYADQTWVISGDYKDLTPDLSSTSNVAVYTGLVPQEQDLQEKTYRSDLGDPSRVSAGDAIEFRGSQTGQSKGDFPEKVDGLLVKTPQDELTVLRTGNPGEVKPITSSSVTGTRVKGGLELLAAALVLGGGVFAAVRMAKKNRLSQDY